MKKISDEILYTEEEIVTLDSKTIEFLKEQARKNKRQRVRLCTHRDTDALVHEMIIVHSKGTYVEPHKHINKSESFHVIEGLVDLYFFDEDGKVIKILSMGDRSSGKIFYHRISDPIYHSLIVRSDVVVFQETTKGPFNRFETIWAPWAPDEGNEEAVKAFMDELTNVNQVMV